jgi:hypothetical protein
MDYCSDIDNSMGTWTGEQLHDGRVHTYPAGAGDYCCPAQRHWLAAAKIAGGKKEGLIGDEIFQTGKQLTNSWI